MPSRREQQVVRRRLDRASMVLTFPAGRGRYLERWQAYRDEAARLASSPASPLDDACVYELDLRIPSLAAPGRVYDFWRVVIDLDHVRYPRQIGWPAVVSQPLPFNPHVSPSSGIVCTGTLWHSTATLAGFVVRLMRMLNFDEVLPRDEAGLNPAATRHWRAQMGARPLDPAVVYPAERRPADEAEVAGQGLFGAVSAVRGRP